MKKSKRAERAKEMLSSLGEEQAHGGFSEFSLFCEEWLEDNLHHVSEEGLKHLMDEIETASMLGITRRKTTLEEGIE